MGLYDLEKLFELQEEFMELLEQEDRLPPWPVDLTTKQGQRMIKEIAHCAHEELWEATHTLKNKMHRLTDAKEFDRDHYLEEIGDFLAFGIEMCIMSGVTAKELYNEYVRKNKIVKERFRNGY